MERRKADEFNASWRDLRNKLDAMLLATNVFKTNDAMQACRVLDTMSPEERATHIQTNWGPQYFERARPILLQIETLETKIAQMKEESA
jgi:hypothetical protein